MASLEISPLTHLDIPRFRTLAAGYTSNHTYQFTKTETDDQTNINLKLHPLAKPYIKKWPPDPEIEAHYQEILGQELSLGLVTGSNLAGIAIAEKRAWNRTLWVWEFHIDPQFRLKGYGRMLMDALAALGREADCRVIVCETQNTNVPAIRFYRRAGFEVGGVEISYYTNQDADNFEFAIFMKRYLEPEEGD